MFENHERFQNVSAGIQSIMFTIAVIIGGIWTMYTFSTLAARERAQADLAKTEADLEKEKIELFRQAVLDVTIVAKQEYVANNRGYYISAVVKITNKGNRNTFLDFREPSLDVLKIEFDNNGNSTASHLLSQENLVFDTMVVRNSATVEFPFLIKVPNKGFYMLSFAAKPTREELEVYKESSKEDEEGVSWPGSTYVLVK